jgi:hypothetical protein
MGVDGRAFARFTKPTGGLRMLSIRRSSLSFFALATLAAGCSSEPTGASALGDRSPDDAARATSAPDPALTQQREEWRKAMAKTPPPKDGCFTATHPSTTWEEVPCATAPTTPHPPAKYREDESGPRPNIVGNGAGDYTAVVSGTIASAIGSFPSMTGVTSADNVAGGTNYSLQINSNPFNYGGGLCAGSTNPSQCYNWEQFVFEAGSGQYYIEYWLVGYLGTCPANWTYFAPTATTGGGCFQDTAKPTVAAQPITNLASLSLTGAAGSSDSVTLSIGDGKVYSLSNPSVLGLNSYWNTAEFNVFGSSNGAQVTFNPGSTIVVQILTNSATPTTAAPTCGGSSFTAEQNSLNLGTCSTFGGSNPGIQFSESNVLPPGCQLAATCNDMWVPAGYNPPPEGYHTIETITAYGCATTPPLVQKQLANGLWVGLGQFVPNAGYPGTTDPGIFAIGGEAGGATTWGAPIGSVQTVRACADASGSGCDSSSTVTIPNCCVPLTCGNGSLCGRMPDGCGGELDCSCNEGGACGSNGMCSYSSGCAKVFKCPKGSAWDPVNCDCEGLN